MMAVQLKFFVKVVVETYTKMIVRHITDLLMKSQEVAEVTERLRKTS